MSGSTVGRDVHSLSLSMQRLLCLPTTPPRGTLKDGFGGSVVARDVPEPYEVSSLDSFQKQVPVGPQGS